MKTIHKGTSSWRSFSAATAPVLSQSYSCNVDMFRDDNIDVTLAVLEHLDKIHLAALL